jgi:hypothetical protein
MGVSLDSAGVDNRALRHMPAYDLRRIGANDFFGWRVERNSRPGRPEAKAIRPARLPGNPFPLD